MTRPHDPYVCGIDGCDTCKACLDRTMALRAREAQLERVEALCARLKAAGIEPGDLAELVWAQVSHRVEGDIMRMADEYTRIFARQILEGCSLVATITGLAEATGIVKPPRMPLNVTAMEKAVNPDEP